MKRVTLALFTYNRPEKALALINSLDANINWSNTELIVIENNSEKTIDVCELPQTENIKYYLKETNRGLDRSILQACYYAKRKDRRIWFLCDDDELDIKNIESVINLISASVKKVCYVPWYRTDGSSYPIAKSADAYKRMSFLPCVSLNPSGINFSKLFQFCGTNYFHVAVVNHALNVDSNIENIAYTAGTQTRNETTRFPIFKTFFDGYKSVINECAFLDSDEIDKLLFERAYASLVFLRSRSVSFAEIKAVIMFVFRLTSVDVFHKIKFLAKVGVTLLR